MHTLVFVGKSATYMKTQDTAKQEDIFFHLHQLPIHNAGAPVCRMFASATRSGGDYGSCCGRELRFGGKVGWWRGVTHVAPPWR